MELLAGWSREKMKRRRMKWRSGLPIGMGGVDWPDRQVSRSSSGQTKSRSKTLLSPVERQTH